MSPARIFLIFCLIVYAVFQFYQAYSSFVTVFIEYKDHFEVKIKFLTVYHIFGLIISSVLLIAGGIKSKKILLLSALPYLIYKVGFFFWHLQKVYDLTIGCEETREAFCDPKRLIKFYQHILMFSKKQHVTFVYRLSKCMKCYSSFGDDNHSNDRFDYQIKSKGIERKR